MAGGDIRRSTGADAAPINNFMQWFQEISANMNAETQRALVASRKAASSVFTDVGDDEDSSAVAKAAPA